MKNLNTKITVISLIIVIIAAIFFFTKDNSYEVIQNNELYIQEKETLVAETIIIHISGEVLKPGILELPSGSRIADAIKVAGGTTPNADISKVNLAYTLRRWTKIIHTKHS